jgi:hypothetical protein
MDLQDAKNEIETITRSAFDALSPTNRARIIKDRIKIVDDPPAAVLAREFQPDEMSRKDFDDLTVGEKAQIVRTMRILDA